MSLVIHTIVRDGIVVSADTRTTCKDSKGNTRYEDTFVSNKKDSCRAVFHVNYNNI